MKAMLWIELELMLLWSNLSTILTAVTQRFYLDFAACQQRVLMPEDSASGVSEHAAAQTEPQ